MTEYEIRNTSNRGEERQTNASPKQGILADLQFSNHERVQRPAGDVAAEAEGARPVGGEGQAGGLARVGRDGEAVSVKVQPVHHIRADEFDRHAIAGVDADLTGAVCKLAGFDAENAFHRRGARRQVRGAKGGQWSKGNKQCRYSEQKPENQGISHLTIKPSD